MDLIHDLRPFCKGFHQMSVIATDLAEAEAMIKALAEEERSRTPQFFAGKEACVYVKFPYIPPCEPFKELRRLILRIRENTGLRANFSGVVAIEVSEWVGHEREEYFTVLLKYLYDHRNVWKIAAVLNRCSQTQISRFLSECSRYITPRLFDVNVFGDQDTVCNLIRNEFLRRNKHISRDAVDLLAAALSRQELKCARSLVLIERTVEEIICVCEPHKTVTVALVRGYLHNPYSTLTMMAGMPLLDERSAALEKESLQLRG